MGEAPKDAKYIVYLDDEGKVIDGEVVGGGDLEYDEEEVYLGNSIQGAYLYTHNGCCWRLVRGVWKCRKRYCR